MIMYHKHWSLFINLIKFKIYLFRETGKKLIEEHVKRLERKLPCVGYGRVKKETSGQAVQSSDASWSIWGFYRELMNA